MDYISFLNKIPIEQIELGMQASCAKTITILDVNTFAEISGDNNPIHLDAEYAKNSRYKKQIAHGLLSASFFSALFGTKIPGEGCVYVSQSLSFLRPVYIEDIVVATIEVIAVDLLKRRVFFKTICRVKNKIVIDGEAELYIP